MPKWWDYRVWRWQLIHKKESLFLMLYHELEMMYIQVWQNIGTFIELMSLFSSHGLNAMAWRCMLAMPKKESIARHTELTKIKQQHQNAMHKQTHTMNVAVSCISKRYTQILTYWSIVCGTHMCRIDHFVWYARWNAT